MSVTIMSRADAIRYCHQPHSRKTVMISISDPYESYRTKPFTSSDNGVVSVLCLSFCDADRPGTDVYGHMVTERDLMTDADASRVAALVKGHPNEDVIVHCDAGISRSAGVAAAIAKFRSGDDTVIFKSYRPNMWAYRKTLNALFSV